MAYLEIDFVLPIALLFSSIVGVVLVRSAVARGERRAKDRTRRILEAHGALGTAKDRRTSDEP